MHIFGSFWPFKVLDQDLTGRGLLNRNFPIGGSAYGIDNQVKTGTWAVDAFEK